MKVSVVIPVHNKAAYLQACLDSVLAQHYTDFELIAVDDASTDGSLAMLRACSDPRMRVIALDRNLGPGMAAQRGMDEARGEYIVRVDADDVQLPERIARQVAFLDANPTVGAVGAAIQLMGGGDAVRRKPTAPEECRLELLFGVALHQPASAYRRSILQGGGIRYQQDWPWVGEDWLLQLELARVTRLANQEEVLVRYRMAGQGISHGRDKASDLAALHGRALAAFGLPVANAEQLALHALVVKSFPRPPDAAQLRAFKVWLRLLAGWNVEQRVFDQRLLEDRLRSAWDELLYHLPQFGWRVTWAYLRLGARPGMAQLYYLLRSFLATSPPARWQQP